jgi:hypothetical protein
VSGARVVAPAVAALLALATGCGSTVQTSATQVPTLNGALAGELNGPTQLGSPLSSPTGTSAGTGDQSGTGFSADGAPVPGARGGRDATSAPVAGRPGAAATGSRPQAGVGVFDDRVLVGITYTVNADAAQSAFGTNFASGDTKADYQAVVDWVNRHGGVGGRKLVPVWRRADATSTTPYDQQAQAACQWFTVDHHVFAILDSSPRPTFLSCIRGKALDVGGYETNGYTDATFQEYPDFYDVNTLTAERQYGNLVPVLVRQEWFGGWNTQTGTSAPASKAVVGVLAVDDKRFANATDHVLLPALAQAGHPVDPDNVVRIYDGSSQAEVSRTVADIQGAVLKFRSNGVTHVIIFDANGGVTLFFSRNADGQNYFPRYGVTSANFLPGLVQAGEVPARDANGAGGLGFLPMDDLPAEANPDDSGPYTNSTRQLCLKIFHGAGITFPDANSKEIGLGYCDKVLFFARAAGSVSGPLNLDTFRLAVNSLGRKFTSSPLAVSRFNADHHFAVVRGYDMRWHADCTCMKYAGAFDIS